MASVALTLWQQEALREEIYSRYSLAQREYILRMLQDEKLAAVGMSQVLFVAFVYTSCSFVVCPATQLVALTRTMSVVTHVFVISCWS